MSHLQQAHLLVHAQPPRVRAALLDPTSLPDWNPAFLTISGSTSAAIGERYPITVRPGISGTFAYTEISDRRIGTAWSAPGFHEDATWELQPHESGTLVSHWFEQTGPLAMLLRRAYRGVAELRLGRLADRVSERPRH